MKKLISCLVFAVVATGAFADIVIPETTDLSVTQRSKGRIGVRYSLTAPAVVTFDVTTNGVSVGADKLAVTDGDVCRELSAGSHEFVWDARAAIPDWRADLKVVLTAWPLNDKPPYMVVDVSTNELAAADRIRYYAELDAVPGGITANVRYKTDAIVFRRINARCRPLTFSGGTKKTTVTMTNDYYLAVFETTQAQWARVWKGNKLTQLFLRDGDGRPVDNTTYCYIRESKNNTAQTAYQYPLPPNPDSYLGNLRTLCGDLIDFDLPTANEWLYAATGGYGYSYWGDGTPVTTSGNQGAVQNVCPNLDELGRYAKNGGWVPKTATERSDVSTNDVNHGTAIVGTYRPNAFGLYDMHGNVLERVADQRNVAYGGDCHNSPGSCVPQTSADEVQATAYAYSYSRGTYAGFRLACRNGLK